MLINFIKPKDSLNTAYHAKQISNADLQGFADEIKRHIADIDAGKEEEYIKKQSFVNDSNTLDREFYNELLHILGLEEVKEGGKKLIKRKKKGTRDDGSLMENCLSTLKTENLYRKIPNLSEFGDTDEEQLESIALELCMTWLNRILFMKLLEGQLISFNKNDKTAFSSG